MRVTGVCVCVLCESEWVYYVNIRDTIAAEGKLSVINYYH